MSKAPDTQKEARTKFGQVVQRAWLRQCLSQRELARRMGIDRPPLKEIEYGAASSPSDAVICRMAQELGADAGPLLAAAAEADCERIGSRAVREPRMQALVSRLAEVELTGAQIDRLLAVVDVGPVCEGFDAGGGRGGCGEYNGAMASDVTMEKLTVLAAGLVGLMLLLV